MTNLAVFDIRGAELPLAGYTLILRAPLLHQHRAIVEFTRRMDPAPVVDALRPAIEALKTGDGSLAGKLIDCIPGALGAVRDTVLTDGVDALFEAAAVCLDTRANHRRLSAAPTDPDFDPAKIGEFETDAGGTAYLQCPSLRAWVAGNLGVDGAFWVVAQAVAIAGYSDMGKAALAKTWGAVSALIGKKPEPTAPTPRVMA